MKKILIALAIVILVMPMVMALEIDNVKRYDTEKREVTIVDNIGMGDDLVKIKLISPDLVQVPIGENQKVAEFEITVLEDYNSLFQNMEFYDRSDNLKEFSRNFDYRYRVYGEKQVPDTYKETCNIITNATYPDGYEECNTRIATYKNVTRYNWVEFKDYDFKKGEVITVGVFTDTKVGDWVEWIPTFSGGLIGIRVEEWASWTAGLNVGLISAYAFNETQPNFANLYNVISPANNRTNITGATLRAPGMSGTSGRFNNGVAFQGTGVSLDSVANGTISLWIQINETATNDYITGYKTGGYDDGDLFFHKRNTDDFLRFCIETGAAQPDIVSNAGLPNNVWIHVAVTFGEGGMAMWLNGTKQADTEASTQLPTNYDQSCASIGANCDSGTPGDYWYGLIDEYYVWNRTLSQAEIDILYDSGTGTFLDEIAGAPTMTIVVPINNSNYSTAPTTLDYTYVEAAPAYCWQSRDAGVTNTSKEVMGTNFTGLASNEGDNNWTLWCNNTGGDVGSANVYFLVDTNAPVPVIVAPTATDYNVNISSINYTYTEVNPGYCWQSIDEGATNSTTSAMGTNFTDVISAEGSNTWTLWCNDTSNNVGKTTVTFNKDTVVPLPAIVAPTNTTYADLITTINYTYVETNGDACWMTRDAGATNTSAVPMGTNLSSLTTNQGDNNWTLWCNDTFGNMNYTNVTFFADSIAPIPTIVAPTNTSYIVNISSINYTYVEANPGNCWYSVNNGTVNSTTSAMGTNFSTITSVEGTNNWSMWCNDTANNIGKSSITFFKDTILPGMSIVAPANTTFSSYISTINYTYTETNPGNCWMTRDAGAVNTTTVAMGTNLSSLTSNEGDNNYTLWCNDSYGNLNYTNISFTIAIPPIVSIVAPTNISYAVNISTLNYTYTEDNPGNCWYSRNESNSTTVAMGTNLTTGWNEGANNYTLWCNDTFNNLGSDTVSFSINTGAPVITIVAPTNASFNYVTTSLNYTYTGNNKDACWYSTDYGVINSSAVPMGTNFTGLASVEGNNNWTVFCNNTLGAEGNSTVRFSQDSVAPDINVTSPFGTYDFFTIGTKLTLNWTTGADAANCWYDYSGTNITLDGCTLGSYAWNYHNVSMNVTETSATVRAGMKISATTNQYLRKVNVSVNSSANTCYVMDRTEALIQSASVTSGIATFTPVVSLSQDTIYIVACDSAEAVYNKSYQSGGENFPFSNETIKYQTGYEEGQTGYGNITNICNVVGIEVVSNTTEIVTAAGNQNLTMYVNDSAGNTNSSFVNWSYSVLFNSQTYNATGVYETDYQTLTINVTKDSSYSTFTGELWYAGTTYTASGSGSGDTKTFTYQLTVPTNSNQSTNTTNQFNWIFDLDGTKYNSTGYSQVVAPINLSYCTTGTQYINVTFKDEEDDSVISAEVVNDWQYSLSTGSININRTNIYTDTTNQTNYTYCFAPNTVSIDIVGTSDYDQTLYPQRSYNHTGTYDNVTDEVVIYLLSSSDGDYSTFQVLTPSGSTINGVTVTVETIIDGSYTLIDFGTTDGAGTVTFWVNPDDLHRFTFSYPGYDDVVETISPTEDEYTIYMGEVISGNTTYDFNREVWYDVLPRDRELSNQTFYVFEFGIDSNYWALEEYGFVLKNGSGNVVTTMSGTTAGGGNLTVNLSTVDNSSFIMEYYWIITGNYSNGTIEWTIQGENYGFGLKTFVERLKGYVEGDDKIFGLTDFGLTLIIFLIIFMITGSIGYVSGTTSPTILVWLVALQVFFFDIVAGLIALPGGAKPGFVTIMVVFLAIIISWWESMR